MVERGEEWKYCGMLLDGSTHAGAARKDLEGLEQLQWCPGVGWGVYEM